MCRAPSEFRCGSKLVPSLRGAKPKQTLCAVDHTTSSLIRRIKGGFLRRIAKKTFGALGPADSLSNVNPFAAVNLNSCRRNLLPYTINLHWLTLFIYWGNQPIFHKKADIHGSQNYLGIRVMKGKWALNLYSPRVSHSISKYKEGIVSSWLSSIPLIFTVSSAAAAAKSLQSCSTLCDPIDGSPPGSPISGILQARTLEWVAISFSNTWKWKVKVKSCLTLSDTPWIAAHQAPPSMGFSRQEYWSGVPLPSLYPELVSHKSKSRISLGQMLVKWSHKIKYSTLFSFESKNTGLLVTEITTHHKRAPLSQSSRAAPDFLLCSVPRVQEFWKMDFFLSGGKRCGKSS